MRAHLGRTIGEDTMRFRTRIFPFAISFFIFLAPICIGVGGLFSVSTCGDTPWVSFDTSCLLEIFMSYRHGTCSIYDETAFGNRRGMAVTCHGHISNTLYSSCWRSYCIGTVFQLRGHGGEAYQV